MEPQFSPAPPGFPRRFGAYLLLSPIAQGGMGDVFLASTLSDSGASRLVVIKTLREDLSMEPGYVNRFLDEARIVIQLHHPNISQVFDVGCHEGTHFFAMEHILGTNVRRLIGILSRDKVKIPPSLAMFVAAEVLDGLHAAHHHRHALTDEPLQVVHRDVSPQNIMISTQGEVKVIDFGLAESVLKVEQTETKVVLGKIAYMSPEQARGEEVDARTDQYSAAVVLYELATGDRFYGDRGQHEIWAVAGVGFLPDRLAHLDPELGFIVKKALSPKAANRYASCGDMSAALRHLLAERSPEIDRAALRDFTRRSATNELEASEKNVRALSQLALRTVPDLAVPRAAVVDVTDSATGATQTNVIAAAPTVVPAAAPRPGLRVAAIAASALLLMGLVTVFVVNAVSPPSPPVAAASPDAGVPTVVPPIAVAPVGSATMAVAPSSDDAGPTAVAPPVAGPDATTVAPVRPVKKPPVKKPTVSPPSWAGWSMDQKMRALGACSETCARTFINVRAKGGRLVEPLVDNCLRQCKVR